MLLKIKMYTLRVNVQTIYYIVHFIITSQCIISPITFEQSSQCIYFLFLKYYKRIYKNKHWGFFVSNKLLNSTPETKF